MGSSNNNNNNNKNSSSSNNKNNNKNKNNNNKNSRRQPEAGTPAVEGHSTPEHRQAPLPAKHLPKLHATSRALEDTIFYNRLLMEFVPWRLEQEQHSMLASADWQAIGGLANGHSSGLVRAVAWWC